MFVNNQDSEIDTKQLGKWLEDNQISRSDLANALGLKITVIHNWFSRQRIPRNVQASIRHYMNAPQAEELQSQISIRIKNQLLNEAMKEAVRSGETIEEWIVGAINTRLGR